MKWAQSDVNFLHPLIKDSISEGKGTGIRIGNSNHHFNYSFFIQQTNQSSYTNHWYKHLHFILENLVFRIILSYEYIFCKYIYVCICVCINICVCACIFSEK